MAKTRKELELERKLKRIKMLEEKAKLIQGLPHLYGFKFYKWQREFFESEKRFNFICGANQLGKSTLLARKCIHWATEPSLWPRLWRSSPRIFLYFYPNMDMVDIEVKKKWATELLPRGEYETHPQYGWKIKEERGKVVQIDFNSGVTVYFKSYSMNPSHVQGFTAHAAFVDEEVPENFFPEIKSRLSATGGHYHAAFTATLGQDFWRQVLEDKNPVTNPFPDALKFQVSLYDCQEFEDGSPSFWTDKKIEEEIRLCPNEREVQRRVFGKFVKAEGLKFPSFDRLKNIKPPSGPPPKDWLIYAGVDLGSGSSTGGHPSAMVFLAVRPDFRFGRVFRHWNGKGQPTTASDVLQIFQEQRGAMRCAAQVYDYSARDFYTIASRAGESFFPADKTVEAGENTLNSLFKNGLLVIDDIPENTELIRQLEGLYIGEKKSKAVDDSCDALRYCALVVPWDWQCVVEALDMQAVEPKSEGEKRRDWAMGKEEESQPYDVFEEELAEWNSYFDIN